VGGMGAASVFTGAALISWTETADFCGRCHAMGPELTAYENGPHNQVACAECHVEPGIQGWVKAKINGTRQLVEVILGVYPTPIPPPDHEMLPSTQDTCLRCHDIARLAPANLVTKTQFAEDEPNTRQFVGLLIRPGGGDPTDVGRSAHWHVLRTVDYIAADETAQKIDYVAVPQPDGTTDEYIAQDKITDTSNVAPDLAAVKEGATLRTMSCLDCHNRVGHPLTSPRQGLDAQMTINLVDPSLPYVKREGMQLLDQTYPSVEAADAAIDQLSDFYKLEYPRVYADDGAAIDRAMQAIKNLYPLTATPEMKATFETYPNNLGHIDFPGCFRCHDGGHFLVKNGVVTNTTIPSTCDTCHTWPQIGDVASLPLGTPPATHSDELWVFDHKNIAPSANPGGTVCGQCHAADYCTNCHKSGAISVNHDEMLTNHAQAIRDSSTGAQACAYCHQPVYCARCHAEPVLPTTNAGGTEGSGGVPEGATVPQPKGLQWPLLMAARP
jgi:nitrate/TMAO reductase-like tetraheme cytochrome c subunit